MAKPDMSRGEGELREAAIRRRRFLAIGALFALGAVTGFYMGFRDGAAMFHMDGSWSPAMALALTAAYVIAIIGGTVVLHGVMDELERQRTYKATSFAAAILLVGYPIWFLLWKGGFVAAPIHWLMYAIFVVALGLAMLWYRYR